MSSLTLATTNPSVGDPQAAYLAQATPVQNTWYTVANIINSGVLTGLRASFTTAGVIRLGVALQVRITVDGGAAVTFTVDSEQVDGNAFEVNDSANDRSAWWIPLWMRFETSLLVEIRTTVAATDVVAGKVFYTTDQ